MKDSEEEPMHDQMDDPIELLRRAWGDVTPPDATAAEVDDGATEEAVQWMRSAWQSLEIEAQEEGPRLAFRRPGLRVWSPIALTILMAAAAAVLLLVVLQRDSVQPLFPDAGEVPLVATGPNDSSEFDPSDSSPANVRSVSLLPNGSLELRRGRVRLIFPGQPLPTASTAPDDGPAFINTTNTTETTDTQDQ